MCLGLKVNRLCRPPHEFRTAADLHRHRLVPRSPNSKRTPPARHKFCSDRHSPDKPSRALACFPPFNSFGFPLQRIRFHGMTNSFHRKLPPRRLGAPPIGEDLAPKTATGSITHFHHCSLWFGSGYQQEAWHEVHSSPTIYSPITLVTAGSKASISRLALPPTISALGFS